MGPVPWMANNLKPILDIHVKRTMGTRAHGVAGLLSKDLGQPYHICVSVELFCEVNHSVSSILLITRPGGFKETGEGGYRYVAALVNRPACSYLETNKWIRKLCQFQPLIIRTQAFCQGLVASEIIWSILRFNELLIGAAWMNGSTIKVHEARTRVKRR